MENPSSPGKHKKESAMIKNLTEEKNTLMKIISHDIRGPFNQMFALLRMFEMEFGTVTGNQQDYINRMYRAVLGGMEMIRNLHDARSLDNGNITLNPEPVELKKLVRTSVRNFSIQCRIKGSQVSFNDSGPDVTVDTDKILLGKILDNVISNALKYSEPGCEVSICFTYEGGKNIISVKDQGPGLSAEELTLMFNKFQKLSPKPTLGEATSGLGMYLAREFSGMLKCEVKAENNPGKGLLVKIII